MSSSNGHAAVLVAPSDEVTHAFQPRDPEQPWGLCLTCGFGESAHIAAVDHYGPHGSYRCPDCVTADKPNCNHSHGDERSL